MPRLRHRAAAVLAVLVLSGGGAVSSQAAPPANDYGRSIEPLARYEGQTVCDPVEKPGVAGFRALLRASYPANAGGISRACTIGGRSEHKEGRAYDWANDSGRAADRVRVNEVLTWLLSTDCYGNQFAMARRLGIMYIIWDGRIWSAYQPSKGWAPYNGPNPHAGHVHFSFSWAGARQQTSYWTTPSSTANCVQPGTAPTRYPGYVSALYEDFLGRPATAGDVQWWTDYLSTQQMTPQQLAYSLSMSDEYINTVVGGFYRSTLGREPDAAGLDGWRRAVRAGMPVDQVASAFFASPEFFARVGGTNEAWVRSLYGRLLEREAEPGADAYWAAIEQRIGRVEVVRSFYVSEETLRRRVDALYLRFLDRPADPGGLSSWPAVVARSGDFALASFLASSPEYFARADRIYG